MAHPWLNELHRLSDPVVEHDAPLHPFLSTDPG